MGPDLDAIGQECEVTPGAGHQLDASLQVGQMRPKQLETDAISRREV